VSSSSSAGSSLISNSSFKREPLWTTEVFGFFGHACTGGPPSGKSCGLMMSPAIPAADARSDRNGQECRRGRKLRKRRRDVVRTHEKSAGDEGHQRTYCKTARSGGLGFGDMRRDCIHQRWRQTIIRLEPQFLEACPDTRHLIRLDAGFDHRRYERRKSRSCRALLLE